MKTIPDLISCLMFLSVNNYGHIGKLLPFKATQNRDVITSEMHYQIKTLM